ncbi:15892_t:CDS:2 [Cetraspora pellucida]|uniref:15892_t:CDS:1 n=1 Tax=Cetraspora pellucida TaxID=1433469 RepID=A0ACA9KMR6_9GLOM|nr:15892_t:CDS:2 [Cetraspora pellucida]
MKGKLINKGQCPIKFYHILPNNLNECLFIVIISIGIHNHLPSPPTKTPYNIVKNLQKIIENEYDLDLIARKFLIRPMLKIYLQGKSLSSLHPSLNNQSQLNYLIKKNKKSKYSFSQDIIRVAHELLKQKELSNPYIRSVIKAYQCLFEKLFNTIEKNTKKQFKFQYIHRCGLGCIIADEHQGQALGLGQFLHSKYSYLSCEEHLKHIYKLCQIHFNHNFKETKELMYSITTLNTQDQILDTLTKIKEFNKLEAAAGLSLSFTKMKSDIWNQTPNNTNANESAHANINQDGQFLSLLTAIYRNDLTLLSTSSSITTSRSSSITTPMAQEQLDYLEWENKKLELQQKNLAILKEEIALREKLNNLKQ